MTVLLLAAGAALCVLVGVWGFALRTSGDRVAVGLVEVPRGARKGSEVFILDRVADLLGTPFARPAADLVAPWRARIRKRIDAAGRPGGLTVEGHARRVAGYAVLFGLLGLGLAVKGHPFLGFLVACGVVQPEVNLYGKKVTRQDDIQRSMPDFLDVLAVTVSAGLSFRLALSRVTENMPGALADEFTVALQQMELGTPRRDAFEDMRERNNSEALNQFVTALLQAEELGAPLNAALTDIGNDMRRDSAQWAKRKAQRTTPKITAVTMGMTLPALMLVVISALWYGSGVGSGGLFGF
ncbi:type II secretion system F family protein [Actinomadura parmotrematis]|uniref:Type II secretion system F family protein n=1 Tax=Actinomadura parmotrematis TaxID=2864039 RepID=A0ABS7FX03_9ACTN|nr:type II secretion system F family protein [Actinomadura parmotrematis]MBW8484954.1 type II secretion system F family protein [Actinomadura parmotrematis]